MKRGIQNEITIAVTKEKTALEMGSGTLEVFATPAMIALMEQTAAESVENELGGENTSVGTLINVQHLAATPVGMQITCKSTLTEIVGRTLIFEIEAHDEVGLIGKAYHERFIVNSERFVSKTREKLKK